MLLRRSWPSAKRAINTSFAPFNSDGTLAPSDDLYGGHAGKKEPGTERPPAGGSVKQVISDTKHLALTPY